MQPPRTATIAAAGLAVLGFFGLWLMILLTREVWTGGANVGDLAGLLMIVLGAFGGVSGIGSAAVGARHLPGASYTNGGGAP